MIVVTNRLPVAEGRESEFEERFRKRAGLIDGCKGFVRNEIHRPLPMKRDPETGAWTKSVDELGVYEVKTWWETFDDFVAWTQSDAFRAAHRDRGGPNLLRGPSELVMHEVIA